VIESGGDAAALADCSNACTVDDDGHGACTKCSPFSARVCWYLLTPMLYCCGLSV
jgi:hypothetical protein